jgi:phosphatidylserine/phosphatidylglycerophosphate/cardiolipin synthase-like enzyme
MLCEDYAPGDVTVCLDGHESARALVRLLRGARRFVFYSAFICDVAHPLPGTAASDGGGPTTLLRLFNEMHARSVELRMLYNDDPVYHNAPVATMRRMLPPSARVKVVRGSGTIAPFLQLLCGGNTSYTNHHQKYVVVDGRYFMLGGTDVNWQRTSWRVLNKAPPPLSSSYSWHETSVVVPCTADVLQFAVSNFEDRIVAAPPFPLLHGGPQEHQFILHLIDTARSCIHFESQTCISSDKTQNRVFAAVAARVARAFATGGDADRFRFIMITNQEQVDESKVLSWFAGQLLRRSVAFLREEATERLGVPPAFFDERVFVGYLQDGPRHIKVHSNMVIQDGHTMLRTSANLSDRSYGQFPCDNELGIVLHGDVVAAFQQRLWRRLLARSGEEPVFLTPEEAAARCAAGAGVVSRCGADKLVADFDAGVSSAVTDRLLAPVFAMEYIQASAPIEWTLLSRHGDDDDDDDDDGDDGAKTGSIAAVVSDFFTGVLSSTEN